MFLCIGQVNHYITLWINKSSEWQKHDLFTSLKFTYDMIHAQHSVTVAYHTLLVVSKIAIKHLPADKIYKPCL